MMYEAMPLGELVESFIDVGLRSFARSDDLKLDKEVAKIGKAIVARGDSGASSLRPLLNDPRERIQFLAAVWLSELDPHAAASTLERLVREALDPSIKGLSRLKLANNRERGLLPAT